MSFPCSNLSPYEEGKLARKYFGMGYHDCSRNPYLDMSHDGVMWDLGFNTLF